MSMLFTVTKKERFFKLFIILLLFPALLINLGLMPYILDEATRALVAIEMMLSGNYVVPTINGEFYYNKPPFYNWILVLLFRITGSQSEIVSRIPVVMSLAGFALTVYLSLKNEIGNNAAFLASIALITCSRIFFYDSFKGLIDITYSWITYTGFYSIYYYHKKDRFLKLFLSSWLLTSIGFLMKGLPSIVFQGISLLVFFSYNRQFRKLFSWESFAGGGIFLLITGIYFWLYSYYNPLQNYWNALWSESAGRTALYHPVKESFIHLFSFPVDFVIQFLPWTLLVVFSFGKGRLKEIMAISQVRFMIFLFIANILVYWISPVIYPRYLFMFLPLLFGTGGYCYYRYGSQSWFSGKILHPAMYSFVVALPILLIFLPFTDRRAYHQDKVAEYLILFVSSCLLLVCYLRYKPQRTLIFIAIWILARIGFNIFVLPDRLITGRDNYFKQEAIETARITEGKPLFLLNDCPMYHTSSYYITIARDQILTRWYDEPENAINYIIPHEDIHKFDKAVMIHTFNIEIEPYKLAVIQFGKELKKFPGDSPFFENKDHSKDDK